MREWTLTSILTSVALPTLALAFLAGCEAQDMRAANMPIPHPLGPVDCGRVHSDHRPSACGRSVK